jgi:hypothetical protein
MIILVLLVLSQAAWTQDQTANLAKNVTILEKLQTKMKAEQADLLGKIASFAKADSNLTNVQVTENNTTYSVTVYRDKNSNILREFLGPDGKLARSMIISPGNGPVLTITYNPDRTVAKVETFEPFGLKKYTEISNSDGTKTEVIQDASLPSDNTLTIKVDANGNVISKEISTTPGLPAGAVYCQVTGQYQEAKAR